MSKLLDIMVRFHLCLSAYRSSCGIGKLDVVAMDFDSQLAKSVKTTERLAKTFKYRPILV